MLAVLRARGRERRPRRGVRRRSSRLPGSARSSRSSATRAPPGATRPSTWDVSTRRATSLMTVTSRRRPRGGCLTEGDAGCRGDRYRSVRLQRSRPRFRTVPTWLRASAPPVSEETPARRPARSRTVMRRRPSARRPSMGPAWRSSMRSSVPRFARAEAAGGCATTQDAPAIGAEVDAVVAGAVAALVAVCGDDIAGPGETCDGTDDFACPGACLAPCVCGGECGDGVTEAPTEECDDGNLVNGDGCSATCQIEDVSGLCAGVPVRAGNGDRLGGGGDRLRSTGSSHRAAVRYRSTCSWWSRWA